MIISMIVAMGPKREIGRRNKMLWHIREDFQHFKKTTMGHTLLMGRKTFESIGRPLPGRQTLILTRDRSYSFPECSCVYSLEEAIQWARGQGETELFIAGGGEIYKQCLPLSQRLYLSEVDYKGEADTYFPPFKEQYDWTLIFEKKQEGEIPWTLKIFEKCSEKNLKEFLQYV